MSQGSIADFGKLYRAAFAERNPERKLLLLQEVQRALYLWQLTEADPAPVSKISAQSATVRSSSIT